MWARNRLIQKWKLLDANSGERLACLSSCIDCLKFMLDANPSDFYVDPFLRWPELTLPWTQSKMRKHPFDICAFSGERGIRTPGGVTLNGFQDRRNRPLCHLSIMVVMKYAERTRFELVVGLLLRQFSKLVVSATHPPLQCFSSLALASAKIGRVFKSAKFWVIFFVDIFCVA